MIELLRAVWTEPRPPDPPPRTWRDWSLVGIIATLAVIEYAVRPDLPKREWALAFTVGLAPTLLIRRTQPLLAVGIAFAVSAVAPLLIDVPDMYTMVYALMLPYALFRWGSGREAAIGLVLMTGNLLVSMAWGRTSAGDTIGGAAVLGMAVTLGVALRYRVKVRARELEQVRLRERESLARDLHDTVAHHFSAIAVRAQAGLAVAPVQPEAPLDALRLIETEAMRALAEMRAIVRVLRRDEPADLTPNPGVADIAGLAGHPGPRVEVQVSGDLRDLAPAVGTALYRLAQESVTNARRHARHATRIQVRVDGHDQVVRLTVRDDGEMAAAAPPGFGLLGMIERAELLGGDCQAGPDESRGWTVTAVLPRNGVGA